MARSKVKVLVGDLFESQAQTLINTVNCVGVMGKGIALEFKNRYPAMYADYQARCSRKQVKLGEPYIFHNLTGPSILNFPTKDHWRMPSSLEAIARGLTYLRNHLQEWGITSLASPPLGCGHGQLDWRAVGPILYQGFQDLNIPVALYAPTGTPEEQMSHEFLALRKSVATESRAHGDSRVPIGLIAVIEVLRRIATRKFYFPGSVEFHKMAYFATAINLPTELQETYVKGSYGPYSEEFQKVYVPRLVRHNLIAQTRQGNRIEHQVGLSYEVLNWKASLKPFEPAIDRLVDLFSRLKSTDQAELYATVHFSAEELRLDRSQVTEWDVLNEVAHWKRRRRVVFNHEEIGDAIRTLNMLQWISVEFSADLPLPQEARI